MHEEQVESRSESTDALSGARDRYDPGSRVPGAAAVVPDPSTQSGEHNVIDVPGRFGVVNRCKSLVDAETTRTSTRLLSK
jgi:hypothetical protein